MDPDELRNRLGMWRWRMHATWELLITLRHSDVVNSLIRFPYLRFNLLRELVGHQTQSRGGVPAVLLIYSHLIRMSRTLFRRPRSMHH